MRGHARRKRFADGTSRVRALLMAARTSARQHWLFTILFLRRAFAADPDSGRLQPGAGLHRLVPVPVRRLKPGPSWGTWLCCGRCSTLADWLRSRRPSTSWAWEWPWSLYSVLLRRGMWRWAAALAATPVLLDGYQLQAEQTIMPDVLFEALIVAGLTLLLRRRIPAAWQVGLAGLALGVAVNVRQVGAVLIVPAVAFLLVRAIRWQWLG